MTDKFHDVIVPRIVAKMTRRAEVGLQQYGHDTTRNDFTLRDWIVEAIDEQIDNIQYLEMALDKLPDPARCPQCAYLQNKLDRHECRIPMPPESSRRFYAYLRNFDQMDHYERWEKLHPEEGK